jgi:peptidoglycan hydrolase CwlO-like protein
MVATAKKEKQEEKVEFAEFSQFCVDKQASTTEEIAAGAETIDLLTTEIQQLESEISQLAEEVDALQRTVASADADVKAQKEQRATDHAEYVEESTDLEESVDALDRAIMVLQKQNYDRKQASGALLQITSSAAFPEFARRAVLQFLEMNSGTELDSIDPPEANAYEFQSGGIVDMLKKLQDDFRKKKSECEKEEMNSKHASDMVVQDLTDTIERSSADISSKSQDSQKKKERVGEAKKELGVTTTDHAEDTKFLSDLEAECHEKSASFKEKQQLRTEEIAAQEKAIEILSGAAVSGAAEAHLSLAATGTSLMQLRQRGSNSETEEGIRRHLLDFLRHEGQRLHSQSLELLASKVAADPFVKVRKMIEDMITRLLEEANRDAENEGFCDKELGTNKITRDKLQSEIDELSAAIDEANANIMKLTEDIAKLTAEVAELDKGMEEATAMREAEKAKNEATIKDAKDAQDAIQEAKSVLEEFYKKAGQATALVQLSAKTEPKTALLARPKMGSDEWDALANPAYEGTVDKGHKEGMQTFGDTYTGQQDEAGGVLAMLEVISSDFANVESSTSASEMQAAKVYEDFMNDSKKSKAVKSRNIEMFTEDKSATKSKLLSDTKDLKVTQDELLAADRYYEKLKPQCVASGVSVEDRQKAREAEIASLKEALKILSGEAIA